MRANLNQSDIDGESERTTQRSHDGFDDGDGVGQGKITLVGIGPGTSCGQLTHAGEAAILSADVIMYDRLTDVTGLKDRYGGDSDGDMGKRFEHVGKRGSGGMRQDMINERILEHARRGLHVVRVKGGDVSIFGRMHDEVSVARANGVEVNVIAGVCTPSVVAARLQFPLTNGGKGVCFISGHDNGGDVDWITADVLHQMTVVIFMGLSNLHDLLNRFNNQGDDDGDDDGGLEQGERRRRRRRRNDGMEVVEEEEEEENEKKDFDDKGGGPRRRDTGCIAAVAVQDVMSTRERIVWGTVGTLSQKVVDAKLESPVLVVIGDVVRFAKDWPFKRD